MGNQDALLAGLQRLDEDLELYCAHCLKIADKSGVLRPFVWNRAQRYIHERLEEQREKTGKVRALILKGRQMGVSTLVAARFYQRCAMNFGQKALIMGHEAKSTNSLYGMVKRFQDYNPLAPSIGATNAQELIFDKLGSGYALATAGTKDVGRGNTAQLAHLSEVAFWSNLERHMAGIGNTVADLPGTEIIIESTPNGMGNGFHAMWQRAEAGEGEWIAIYVPWFWEPGYRAPVSDKLELSDDDRKVMRAYDLDMEQMQWRANKIATYGKGFDWLFRQEYSNTAAESFQTSTKNPLVDPSDVMAAVNSTFRDAWAPLIIGCDPAGDGANDPDRTAIVFRRGRMVLRVEYHTGLNTMQIAGKLSAYNVEHRPAAIFVDKGGLGAGVVDRLTELGAPVTGVLSGQAADDPKLYENKKAEMWWRMQEWFEDQPCRIPNNQAFIADITAPQPMESSNGRKLVEKKDHLKKRGIRSPDGGDALALTFSFPVAAPVEELRQQATAGAPTRAGY